MVKHQTQKVSKSSLSFKERGYLNLLGYKEIG
jgi:hypothetical protein